jgi:hypothetical protein
VSTESEIAAYIFGGMTTMEAPGNGVVGDTKGDIDPANVVEEGGKARKIPPRSSSPLVFSSCNGLIL